MIGFLLLDEKGSDSGLPYGSVRDSLHRIGSPDIKVGQKLSNDFGWFQIIYRRNL